ncbi:hypothetical protein GL264_11325 [Aeromonas jandaei]|uniref:DUF6979 family protein n=1 Tax=Aeromonas jandaei TaxID=650 RepID=UPI001C5A9D75|nr:hypothetical protein [Aeromonas jandaei]MBW3761389.1 hypothetical protein [Aeromonas jandaei]
MDYGKAAVTAAKMCENGNLAPRDAWGLAVKDEGGSTSSQEKSCPKSAFLGLCSEGLVRGVSKGKYSRSVLNSCYAVTAVEILQTPDGQRLDRNGLWEAVMAKTGKQIQHNYQMDVVLALWDKQLIDLT